MGRIWSTRYWYIHQSQECPRQSQVASSLGRTPEMKWKSIFDCDSTLLDGSCDYDSSSVVQFIFQDIILKDNRNIVDSTCVIDELALSRLETVDTLLIDKYNRFENSNLSSFKKQSQKSDLIKG